jgi:CRISPR type I-E-associated protein CasB/Cse2
MSTLTKEQAYQFAGFLRGQVGPTGRANLAELRRAAADSEYDFRDLRILGSQLADDDFVADAQRLTAALFALYAGKFWDKDNRLRLPDFGTESKRRTFGASLRRLRGQLGAGQDSLDLRFGALLDTPHEDLTVPLRGLMQRLATAEKPIPVDFAQLLLDIVRWNRDQPDRRSPRREWARDYWQAAPAAEEVDETAVQAPTTPTSI